MDYNTLGGIISKLTTLKNAINVLKGKCNSEILMLENDQWSKVETYLQNVIDSIQNAIDNWPSTYGTPMKTKDEEVKSK